MGNKCIKLEIQYCNKYKHMSEGALLKELFDIRYLTKKACNVAITYYYSNDMQNMLQKNVGIPKEGDQLIYGKSFGAWVENRMNEEMVGVVSGNVAATRRFVEQRYKGDKKKGLFKGEVSLSNFKASNPIILHNNNYKITHEPKGFYINIGLFNKNKQEELNVKRFDFRVIKPSGNEKAVLERLMSNTYKQGTAQIKILERDKNKKLILIISYGFKDNKTAIQPGHRIMGIDLGIVNTVAISIYDCITGEYVRQRYADQLVSGRELIHYRQKTFTNHRSIKIASKWASDNNSGRGYKARNSRADKNATSYNNFRETYNHKISKYIIDMAIKNGVSIIQMEDLTKITDVAKNKFLKNWSYYDLQNKINYKADLLGIEVIKINPSYTSQRCNNCGNIASENRDCEKNQAKFLCSTCGHKDNADINASKNIALLDIEQLISEQLKLNMETIKADLPT